MKPIHEVRGFINIFSKRGTGFHSLEKKKTQKDARYIKIADKNDILNKDSTELHKSGAGILYTYIEKAL